MSCMLYSKEWLADTFKSFKELDNLSDSYKSQVMEYLNKMLTMFLTDGLLSKSSAIFLEMQINAIQSLYKLFIVTMTDNPSYESVLDMFKKILEV